MLKGENMKIYPAGDMAVVVKTGSDISPGTNRKVRQLLFALQKQAIQGVTEIVPAYNELMIFYQPWVVAFETLLDRIDKAAVSLEEISLPPARLVHIPVSYGEEFGPDLRHVADTKAISHQDVIDIHTGTSYLVYMLGFAPGFCYLGGLDGRLSTPRKENPRTRIPAGSVGIGGDQTGIYPLESPGGWQIIGRTPLKLFDPDSTEPFLLSPGDTIRFQQIDSQEYQQIMDQIEQKVYKPKTESL